MNELLLDIEDGIARLTINRPDQRNALNPEVLEELSRAFRESSKDPAVRVIALTGSGEKVFCAGADLKASLAVSGEDSQAFGRSRFREVLLEIQRCPKPTVALARGHVMAGGLGLYLACDLGLACEDVHFSTPEIHVGMFPMMVLALLYRHVGRRKATEMMFLGERLSAEDAAKYGLVNRVFPRAEFESGADAFLRKLAEKSGKILEMGKEALLHAEGLELAEALRYLEDALGKVMQSEDSKEGIRAFVEKRKPVWKNR